MRLCIKIFILYACVCAVISKHVSTHIPVWTCYRKKVHFLRPSWVWVNSSVPMMGSGEGRHSSEISFGSCPPAACPLTWLLPPASGRPRSAAPVGRMAEPGRTCGSGRGA